MAYQKSSLLLLATACLVMAWGASPPASKKAKVAIASDAPERAYRTNCGRCHQPPESLPNRVTSTVIRHMRVRASLTEQDEMLIRKFMNP